MRRRYNERGNMLAREAQAPAPKPAPVMTQKAKTIDELNDLLRSAARGAKLRNLAYFDRLEKNGLRAARRG
jgi:hypothetical protein